MPTKKKGIEFNAQELIAKYTNYILEHEVKPSSIYKFCKVIGIEESTFYGYYASIEALEAAFFEHLHLHVLKLLHNNEQYVNYDQANKLLTYYFTFFEMATANRSYILLSLKGAENSIERYSKLSPLRKVFLAFVDEILQNSYKLPGEQLQKVEAKLLQEGAWLQFLLTFKYWMDDCSPNFEKTDILIEKSVRASFQIIESFPLQSVVDLGKFLWKERPFQ